jgi:phosphoribosylglycinamide formyltransferase-1
MYGVKVQEAVMEAKEEMAGCTVHFVSAGIDEGRIILQKAITVDYSETPWELGGRIFKEENCLLVDAIRLIMANIENNFGSD